MSMLDWRFIKPILSFSPINAAVNVGDSLNTALEKLQGQISGISTGGSSNPYPNGAIASLTANVTTSGSNETVVMKAPIAGNILKVGSSYLVRLFGQYNYTSGNVTNSTLNLRIGRSGTIRDPLAATLNGSSYGFFNIYNASFMIEFYATVRATGPKGSILAVGKLSPDGSSGIDSGGTDIFGPDGTAPTPILINTAVSNYITATATVGSNQSSLVFYQGTIEQLRL